MCLVPHSGVEGFRNKVWNKAEIDGVSPSVVITVLLVQVAISRSLKRGQLKSKCPYGRDSTFW